MLTFLLGLFIGSVAGILLMGLFCVDKINKIETGVKTKVESVEKPIPTFTSPWEKGIVFQGYEDVVHNFWGLEKAEVPESLWKKKPCLMLDELPVYHSLMRNHPGENEVDGKVCIKGVWFDVYSLNGESFWSYLFKAEDYWKLMGQDDTLQFVSRY